MPRIDDVLVVGVGGQGIILATDVIAEVFLRAGFDAKKSEVHGMAQRGGSVESHVRRGESVHSPLISPGRVQVLLALEGLEALRYAHTLNPQGTIIFDPQRIPPLSVATGAQEYPDDLTDQLSRYAAQVTEVKGYEIASKLGNARAQNSVLMGALASLTELPRDLWLEVLDSRVPAKAVEVNRRAFERGLESMSENR